MKLWYSNTSPYVRKVRAVTVHHALGTQIEARLISATAFSEQAEHNRDTPLGRIPVLQTDEGTWLYSSNVIAGYLDAQGSSHSLYPQDDKRWAVLNLHDLAAGMLDNTVDMVGEKLLHPEAEWWQSRHEQIIRRNTRTLPVLADAIKPFDTELNIGTINAVCVIDFLRFRSALTQADTMAGLTELAVWTDEMNARYACLAATQPCA
ncbi:glutathione S-transferase [Neisseria weixii]|uniref:Glutathione S-transferase n=1 Tax=Neisseria weixii TaxID=1853276 RepID=A0A3N4MU50_9NEIS|nr:glutathione S-transferase family protein [Neisseria weixii]RPD87424.1 glutathione S-transferase [Neisseria weixii]RPD89074.1 glutathione S-transferase [Neisseria weixii]